jgi:hypothetical protein
MFLGVKIVVFMVRKLLPRGQGVLSGLSSAEIFHWCTLDGPGYESLVSSEVGGARCVIYLQVNAFIMIFFLVIPILIEGFTDMIIKG